MAPPERPWPHKNRPVTLPRLFCYSRRHTALASDTMTSIAVRLMNFRQGFRGLLTAALLAVPLIGPLQAQEVLRIAAVVNGEAVSVLDVVERAKLVVASSGLNLTPDVMQRIMPQVLRALIDERLRMQEAERKNISVSSEDIAVAIGIIEQQNRMPANSFGAFLESRQINYATLESRIRAEIAWSKLVSRRLRNSVAISDEDIDDELTRLRDNIGKPEYLISEIFLIVDRTANDETVRSNAEELVKQIRAGADFNNLADQFSEGTSANRGGNVGWLTTDQLDAEVASAIASLQADQVSDPIATRGGYLIVQVRARRQLDALTPGDVTVDLKQILLALPPDASEADVAFQVALAETIRETVSGCDDMVRMAHETDPTISGELGRMRLDDIAPDLREVVRNLPLATPSAPLRTEAGIHLFMVCDRTESNSALPSRNEIRQALTASRADQVARHYLRDLRRTAFVDIRI